MADQNRYERIIEHVFLANYRKGSRAVPFKRADLVEAAKTLQLTQPSNIGDVLYSFRHRTPLPAAIRSRAPEGEEWIIVGTGTSRYEFIATKLAVVRPRPQLVETKVPDSTPGAISMYALSDEQALLAKVRYNRLVDIFSGVVCYSLQSHLRTTVPGIGQVETDEIYIGLDKRGAHYVFPVQAKGGSDKLGAVQVLQDFALCADKFPALICRPIGAQFIDDDLIALFEFEQNSGRLLIAAEAHYRLAPPDAISPEELERYRSRRP